MGRVSGKGLPFPLLTELPRHVLQETQMGPSTFGLPLHGTGNFLKAVVYTGPPPPQLLLRWLPAIALSYPALLCAAPLGLLSMLGDQFQRSIPKAHERTRSSFSTVLRLRVSAIRMKKSTGTWRVLPATMFSKRKGSYPTRFANSEILVRRLAVIFVSVSWNSFIANSFSLCCRYYSRL